MGSFMESVWEGLEMVEGLVISYELSKGSYICGILSCGEKDRESVFVCLCNVGHVSRVYLLTFIDQ